MTSQLEARVAAGKEARYLFSLCKESKHQYLDHFWETLLELVQGEIPNEQENSTELVPMTDQEVTHFRRETMPFGKYAGNDVKDIPLDYLDYLIGQPDNLTPFRRYLKNPSIAKLLQQQLDEGRNYE